MGNFKNKIRDKFTVASNAIIYDSSLSIAARFTYIFMASKPDGWDFIIKPLAKEIGCNIDSLHKYINELIQAGWLVKGEQKNENGKFGAVEYCLMDRPSRKKPSTENTVTENFRDGKNPPLINTDYEIKTDIETNTESNPFNSSPNNSSNEEELNGGKAPDFELLSDSESEKEKGCAEKEKEWDEVLKPWLEYKKERKQTYKSPRAIKALKTKLFNLSNGNLEVAQLIIEQSMANNYAGLFELKESREARHAIQPFNANDNAFNDFYFLTYGTAFVWQSDTSDEVQRLADTISSKILEAGNIVVQSAIPEYIKSFLAKAHSLGDQWLNAHFTPKNINKQFNEIYAYIKSGKKPSNGGKRNNPTGVSDEYLLKLQRDLVGGVQP